ncbi:hypothetical protein AK812_SmicGene47405 [Symbiodinium microadriaticum]|uniref:Uncharacterized protein n=1 Tax=Symbiodinium microadriaticum TaxID=2951 RepID=A0A1Q9BRS3_SYMMI|nr:hypothetical protein AK812_SmicGene47405 [Symbiodinium microadriaticum]
MIALVFPLSRIALRMTFLIIGNFLATVLLVVACLPQRWRSGTQDWRSSGVFLRAKETLQLVTKVCKSCTANIRSMEAVYIRDGMLKLHTKTGSLRFEVVRFLEDEISKGEKKLVRFPDLCLNAADKSAILLQAVSVQAREYLVLHGKTGSWSEMSASLRFYEEQLGW